MKLSKFLCIRILHSANCFALNQYPPFRRTIPFLGLNLFSSSNAVKPISSNNTPNQEHDPFPVTYLTNVLGFTRPSALKASNLLSFKSPDRPNAVISFFKSLGLNDSQISYILKKRPILLQYRTENISPRIDFLQSLGFTTSDIPKILSRGLNLLDGNLETQIIPGCDLLKNVFSSSKDMLYCIRMYPSVLEPHSLDLLAANIETLRDVGLPEKNIAYMVRRNPRAMLVGRQTFRDVVTRVQKIGFNLATTNFVKGIWALRNSESTWKEKMEEYKRWGFSEDEVWACFRLHPWCMVNSTDKINRVFEFLVNEMGWGSSVVMRCPVIISRSLEKTIVPRCTVYCVLLSKGLRKKYVGLPNMLICPEERF